ncbi:hypothetical protein BGX28_000011 [Mortierella sp. GBA30]|nr:hypothetical protein BGX28_000011 [Mortierella sp. GBA30]
MPTSGMHSPPLSGTVEDEAMEQSSASAASAAATKTLPGAVKTEPSQVLNSSFNSGSSPGKQETAKQAKQSISATTVQQLREGSARTPGTIFSVGDRFDSSTNASNQRPTAHSHSDKSMSRMSSRHEEFTRQDSQRSKDLAIQRVLQHGKILKVSRRLRTRLEYAILKIRRGWSKYTLQEVESLIQPACSPRITAKQLLHSRSLQSSPRPSERKRVVKRYPSFETASYMRSSSHPPSMEMDIQDRDSDVVYHPSAPATPTGLYRSRMPSLSQYKDSELFQPAKSLMDIATSKPEPGYVSPYHRSPAVSPRLAPLQHLRGNTSSHDRYRTPEPLFRDTIPSRDMYNRWSAPATPGQDFTTPMDDIRDDNVVPSEAQAARTILMLSSPTRPPPRTLADVPSASSSHSPLGEWITPYSPVTSSPLVHSQTVASTTPSPDRMPSTPSQATLSGPIEDDRGPSYPRDSSYSSRPLNKTYSNLYGMGYEPSSPSPLSSSLFPPSQESQERLKTHSRSSSPTLKRAVRFAAAATRDSESKLNAGRMKDKISGSVGHAEYNSTADIVQPGSQPSYDDKKEYSRSPFAPAPPASSGYVPPQTGGGSYSSQYEGGYNVRASTPPSSTVGGWDTGMGSHGMRTPPPSGGKDMDYNSYGMRGAPAPMPMRRRNSGVVPSGDTTDLSAMYRPSNYSSTHPYPSSSSSSSSSSHRS